MDATTKTCSKCGETKPIAEFYLSRGKPRTKCKSCYSVAKKDYYAKNRQEILYHEKTYREANRDKLLAKKKLYYQSNKEKFSNYGKSHYQANREKRLASVKEYREANREKLLAKQKTFREANREKLLASCLSSQRKAINTINDSYVKHLIKQKTRLKAADIPQQLIEAKRFQLTVIRLLKESNK